MAKYYKSPWGEIRGKLGSVVGAVTRGIPYIRIEPERKITGSVKWAQKHEENEICIQQFNLHQIVFSTLGHIIKMRYETLIYPVWEAICRRRKYRLTGYNLFMKYNITPLLQSIPNPEAFCSQQNMPDPTQILLTIGNLELAQIIKATYEKENGKICIQWNTKCFFNGTPEDKAYLIVIYWELPTSKHKMPTLKPWRTIKIWGDATQPVAKRGDSQASVYLNNLPPSVYLNDSTNFVVYLFFHNPKIGYSPSTATKLLTL